MTLTCKRVPFWSSMVACASQALYQGPAVLRRVSVAGSTDCMHARIRMHAAGLRCRECAVMLSLRGRCAKGCGGSLVAGDV